MAPMPPCTAGQLTVVPYATELAHSGVDFVRYCVKMKVSPLPSVRWMGRMVCLGSGTPGLDAAMAASSQEVILPL